MLHIEYENPAWRSRCIGYNNINSLSRRSLVSEAYPQGDHKMFSKSGRLIRVNNKTDIAFSAIVLQTGC